MDIQPIAYFHSPLTSKFGLPRQSGLATALAGSIVFETAYRSPDAIRGLEDFDYLWIIWQFSANRTIAGGTTVRPPRLGGNTRVGVFASRSPFRPNGLGLSCVRIEHIDLHTPQGPVIHVQGADLMDRTPIFDIKPYIPSADAHPGVRSGFVDSHPWPTLEVDLPEEAAIHFSTQEQEALRQVLALDPRPHFHDDATRIYGMPFSGRDVRFRVADGRLTVTEII